MFLLLHKIKIELEKKAHSLRNQNWLSDVHDYDVFMEWYDALNRLFFDIYYCYHPYNYYIVTDGKSIVCKRKLLWPLFLKHTISKSVFCIRTYVSVSNDIDPFEEVLARILSSSTVLKLTLSCNAGTLWECCECFWIECPFAAFAWYWQHHGKVHFSEKVKFLVIFSSESILKPSLRVS